MSEPDDDVTVQQADALVAQGQAVLIDVREDDEWADGHSPTARHFPMSAFADLTGDLPADTTLLCICHSGGRSAMVSQALNQAGYRARNVTGGMMAWEAAGLPVVS